MKRGQGYQPGYTGRRKPVLINGVYCPSLNAGAREASKQLGRLIRQWEIWRVLNGKLKLEGLKAEYANGK
jgi:hypothetical protein